MSKINEQEKYDTKEVYERMIKEERANVLWRELKKALDEIERLQLLIKKQRKVRDEN